MIRVGLRLAFTGDKESLVRLIVTSIAVALGVGLLWASLASINAVNSQGARGSWLNTQSGGSSATSTSTHTNPLWWLASSDEFEGQTIDRIDVAATGPRSPVPPGIQRLPRSGEFYVSPALARLVATTPAAELGDRFSGREVGTIGVAGLPNLPCHDRTSMVLRGIIVSSWSSLTSSPPSPEVTLQGIDDDLALAPPRVGDLGFNRLHQRDWAVEGHSGVGVFPSFFGRGRRFTVYGQRLTVNVRVGNFQDGCWRLIESLPALRGWSVPSL